MGRFLAYLLLWGVVCVGFLGSCVAQRRAERRFDAAVQAQETHATAAEEPTESVQECSPEQQNAIAALLADADLFNHRISSLENELGEVKELLANCTCAVDKTAKTSDSLPTAYLICPPFDCPGCAQWKERLDELPFQVEIIIRDPSPTGEWPCLWYPIPGSRNQWAYHSPKHGSFDSLVQKVTR